MLILCSLPLRQSALCFLSHSLHCLDSVPPSLWALGGSLLLLGTVTPFPGLSPTLPTPTPLDLQPHSSFSGLQFLSFCLYLPPRRPGPLFLSLCPPCPAACHHHPPAPCRAGSPSAVPPASAVLGRPGNSSWFLEKTTGAERKALSLPGRLPPSLGPGGLSRSRPARGRKPCGFWLLPGGLRIWPPPPGQQPKYYSAGGVGGGGRRPRLKEAFRAARPGASCPQAWASGRPSRDLRWPEGRVLL